MSAFENPAAGPLEWKSELVSVSPHGVLVYTLCDLCMYFQGAQVGYIFFSFCSSSLFFDFSLREDKSEQLRSLHWGGEVMPFLEKAPLHSLTLHQNGSPFTKCSEDKLSPLLTPVVDCLGGLGQLCPFSENPPQ